MNLKVNTTSMTNTLFIGKNLIALDSVDSTNSFAKQLLSNSRPIEGTVIMAKEQFAGRGQMGNTWNTVAGKNITMSVVLYPEQLDADKQFFLNMAVALAVKDFCEFVLHDEIKIKWPNDIYYHDKKLGGILIENTISDSKITSSVIGIGINVNQHEFDELLPNPTSLLQVKPPVGAIEYNITSLVEELCAYLEKYYMQLRQQHFNFLDKGYTEALYRYQQTHEFKRGESTFKGEINGVTKDGKLIIHSGSKELRFGFKEVEYII
jgi:BirA family biotin operon repressor/biotin-[acetyl-CoA-carboxylase] ligase